MAQESITLTGHGSECVKISYPDADPEILCLCGALADADVLAAPLDRPHDSRTASGWCEACEDGLFNQCKRGGCY